MEQTLLIIIGVLAALLVFVILFIFLDLRPKIRKQEQLNRDIQQRNKAAEEELQLKVKYINEVSGQIDVRNTELKGINNQIKDLEARRQASEEQLIKSQQNAEEAANKYYDKCLMVAKTNFAEKEKELTRLFQESSKDFNNAYLEVLKDSATEYDNQMEVKKAAIQELNNTLAEYQSKVSAAVAANKRAEEKKIKTDYYRLQLSQEDIEEIKKLREILPYLRQKEPLNKVIYKVYYEKPYTDLVGRVVGSGIHTGIYKITNITNGMCYIGQATDIAERFKQHIRRGVGADAPGRNKLYPAMLTFGVENFTFEVIEECAGKDLNGREQFWQDYFKAKEFGYSIR